MLRTLVSIPESMASKLDNLAKKKHLSRSDVIRTAIEDWLKTQTKPDAFGILKASKVDGIKLQRKLRSEW
jgi:Arc/MetJ-type ribon-helix-helix transcriptional regulator